MNLGRKPFTVGNTTRYSVDYSSWLDNGVTLVSGTAVVSPVVADIVISAVSVAPSGRRLASEPATAIPPGPPIRNCAVARVGEKVPVTATPTAIR